VAPGAAIPAEIKKKNGADSKSPRRFFVL